MSANIERRKLMKVTVRVFLTGALLFLAGCGAGTGGTNSSKDTTSLRAGMTTEEVVDLLGEPGSSQYQDGFMIWKYSLHRAWVGFIPYFLAFDGSTMRLAGWQENMQEYYANQSLWLESLSRID